MLGKLLFLFIVVPLVELAILVQLGRVVGLWPTIALVLATGAAGALLARAQGFRVLRSIRRELEFGRVPAAELLDGAFVLVGGAFLLTPGLLTDLAGLSLLVPWSRSWLKRRLRARLEAAVRTGRVRLTVLR